jgi:hypothetical protein
MERFKDNTPSVMTTAWMTPCDDTFGDDHSVDSREASSRSVIRNGHHNVLCHPSKKVITKCHQLCCHHSKSVITTCRVIGYAVIQLRW